MIKQLSAILCAITLTVALPAFGMEEYKTYPCDNCQEEKSMLRHEKTQSYGMECLHILCSKCYDTINTSQRNTVDDTIWWDCDYCSYFYHQKNKQCWQITKENQQYWQLITNQHRLNSVSGPLAIAFKHKYPNRQLPEVTNLTQLPENPRTVKIKLLCAACIAMGICYGTYQAFAE